MIAPLSLSNVLTVVIAVTCLSTISTQSRGEVMKLWRLAVPAILAAVQAMVLLASVFDATFMHDAEWLAAAIVGGIIGRTRGWTMPVAVDQARGLVRLPRSHGGQVAAGCLVVLAFIDFIGAALEDAVIPCQYTAAGAALCAGYIGCRAVAIAVRATRAHHVEPFDANTVSG